MASGVILGEWTHRRADAGGARAVSADLERADPAIAWSWRPEHGGRVDQVRIAGGNIFAATLTPRDPDTPGWEHAVVYALDPVSGARIGRCALPDPVPVAAMVVDRGVVHVLATRKGEPIFWYALDASTLTPKHRRVVALDRDTRFEDVLDAWALPDDGLWLELESPAGRAYAFVPDAETVAVTQTHEEDVAAVDGASLARDACASERVLFAPIGGALSEGGSASPPAIWRIEPKVAEMAPVSAPAPALVPAREAWVRSELAGPRAREHTVTAEGTVYAVVAAQDSEREDRAIMQAYAIDRTSSVVRWRTPVTRVPVKGAMGDDARVVRRKSGELVFQRVSSDGRPCTDLVCARADGEVDTFPLGNGKRPLIDAALGDLVLAHHESKSGRVTVGAFEIDREGRLLGRRSVARWTIETPDLGGMATVYAGAGHIVVRGAQAIASVRV